MLATPEQKCPQLPFKPFKVNVSLSQTSWQTVSQPQTCSSKASVSIVAAGPSDDTCPSLGDDDLRQRPADSRRSGKVEPYRTVTSRPEWPS